MAKYTWSYSSATTFEKCPKQYYHLYVAKDIKQDPNQKHFLYGNEVHKAAEEYVRDGVPLPEKFKEFQSIIDKTQRRRLCFRNDLLAGLPNQLINGRQLPSPLLETA